MIDELSQRARAAVRDRRAWALEAEIDTLKGKLAEARASEKAAWFASSVMTGWGG